MINKKGTGYWSIGIIVRHQFGKWAATVEYKDDGFADDSADDMVISTEGKIHTRYFVEDGKYVDGLTAAIDAVKADAERLGIRWITTAIGGPHVHMEGDGNDPDWPAPDGWRDTVNAQSERLGWKPLYTVPTDA